MNKNKILIAVPSNNGITIFKKMLGMAMYFYIYNIDKSKQEFVFVEKRGNPYMQTQQHLKTLDVYELINDCQMILAANIGKNGIERLRDKGVELFFNKGNIQKALDKILNTEQSIK